MIESFIFGAVQGIAEWLPVSSEGLIVLLGMHGPFAIRTEQLIPLALFLHLGTALAALVYFRRDVWELLATCFRWRRSSEEQRTFLSFLILATFVSGVIGVLLLRIVGTLVLDAPIGIITGGIGVLLLVTGVLQLRTSRGGQRDIADLRLADALWLGLAQGLAALPGLSRSGLTVAALLLRRVDGASAFRASFLLSIPIVILGNIVLGFRETLADWSSMAMAPAALALAVLISFVFGLATIRALIACAQRVRFGKLVIGFGILMIVAAFVV
ncbi:MAG: undecaprenyl-diphosphate phosphatase [Candidatus Uhrbacteria bacterium]